MILAVGGPLSGTVIESTRKVVWGSRRPIYFRHEVKNGSRTESVYLHKSVLRRKPQLDSIIRNFVTPADCEILSEWDIEVIAYYWWLLGDEVRYRYARFL